MIEWAEQRRLPKGVLDPSAASLLPKPVQNAQPFFVDVGRLAEKVADFSQTLHEDAENNVAQLFRFMAKSISGEITSEAGFVQPMLDPKRAGNVQALIGPDIDAAMIHNGEAVQAAFESLGKSTPFKAPTNTGQVATKSVTQKSTIAEPVAMGIVDFSIAFLNRRFQTANNKTRFEMLWIQDREPLNDFKPMFPTYQLLGLGTFLMRHDIDALISHFTTNGVLDETAAYAAFSKPPVGLRDSWALREGHGTAVLDHMAGAEPGTHDDDRPLYGVELPTSVMLDTSGQKLLAPLLLGLTAISVTSLFFTPSTTSGWGIKGAPLVMNASLAFTGGPDNNTNKSGFASLLSSVMNGLKMLPRDSMTLTIPTGNHRQDRIHARLLGGQLQSIAWGLPADDFTPSTLEVYVADGSDLQHFALTLPMQETVTLSSADIPTAGFYVDLISNGQIIARLAHQQGFGPAHYTLTLAPTTRRDQGQPIAPSGTWAVTLESSGADIDLWVRRDDRLPGFNTTGRQSWLIDEAYVQFDANGHIQNHDTPMSGAPQLMVYRQGTGSVLLDAMNGGANGIIGVAGMQSDGMQPYRHSGERRSMSAQAPVTAVAEGSKWRGGPVAAARQSQTFSQPAGTSMASARYARRVADAI